MYHVIDNYPGDAAGGCDYLSGAALGEVIVEDASGHQVRRRERVVVTPRHIDFEGQLCIGERTVRHLAHLLGMVDDWRVEKLGEQYEAVASERDELSAQLAEAHRTIETLSQIERQPITAVYVGADRVEHVSEAAAVDASAAAEGRPRRGLLGVRRIREDEAPDPSEREVTDRVPLGPEVRA